jgi:hypothetical protein
MRNKILAIAVATALTSGPVLADTSSMNGSVTGMGILENDYVKAGVNKTSGTFGSGGNTSPGLQYDSSGSGTFNSSYDYLTPGSPFDGWSIKIDGTNSTNNNAGSTSWADADGLTDGTDSFTWQGTNASHSGWQVEHVYSLGATSEYIDITTNITAGSTASAVYFGRFIDPDARAAAGDSSATDNVLGYSGIPDTNVAFSEATVSRYALGLYSANTNTDAGISSSWTTEADGYTDSPYTASGASVKYGTGDHTIGLTWSWTGVSAGDILTADYAYIFGPSAFDAAEEAIDGGAGGGTAGVTPSGFGAVTDEGSATDAAGAGPTVVGSATSSITSHTATETAGVQTIAREKATSTWDVYSDASTGTPVVTTENLSSFAGRVDHVETANHMMAVTHKDIEWNGVRMIKNNQQGVNGYASDVSGLTAAGIKRTESGWGLGIGAGKLTADIDGNGITNVDSTVFHLRAVRELYYGDIAVSVTRARNDYEVSRTVGDFANSAKVTGTDKYYRVEYAGKGSIRPLVGYTTGKVNVQGYQETGSIQSARTVAGYADSYHYATIGVAFDLGSTTTKIVRHTDDTNQYSFSVNKDMEGQKMFTLGVSRLETPVTTSNSVTAGFKILW